MIDLSAPKGLVSLADPRIAALPVRECGEPMCALVGAHSRLRVDASAANLAELGYSPDFSVRQSVLQRLCAAAESLPDSLVLLVKESHRPATLQAEYFDRRVRRLLAEQPGLCQQDAQELASRFVAPPWVAGHPTGGAVDLTLASVDGLELDLGCPYDADEVASQGRCVSACVDLSADALRHRRCLFSALVAQGFANYPFEWWHWSYGDRYWAFVLDQPAALFGPLD